MNIQDLLSRLQPVITWGDAIELLFTNKVHVGNVTGSDVIKFYTKESNTYILYQDELQLFLPYYLAKSLTV